MSNEPIKRSGRPRKAAEIEENEKQEVVETEETVEGSEEVAEKQEENKEAEEARKELAKLKRELAALKKANEPQPQVEVDFSKEYVACLIEAKYANLEAARQSKYYELCDGDGVVVLSCPITGLSLRFKNLTEWPKVNTKFPNKKANSYAVKFKILPE